MGAIKKIRGIKREKMLIPFLIIGLAILFYILIVVANLIVTQLVFDFDGFLEAAKDRDTWGCIGLTLGASFLATGIAFLFGVPLAYLLARKDFLGKGIVEGIIDLPVMIPHVVAGIAIFSVFYTHGLIGGPLSSIVKFVEALPGTVVAMLFVSLPFFINPARDGFKSVDPRLENVSRSLGASQWKTFCRVSFPLASRELLSGVIMSWGRGISEFAAITFLAYYPMVASTLIWDKFWSGGLEAARPIAVLLILVCLVIFVGLRLISEVRR
jgi:molybdate/tungstate transport system permease protein